MTEETLKGLSIDKLSDLLIKTAKGFSLINKEDKPAINVIEGNVLLLRRVMVSKWIKDLPV